MAAQPVLLKFTATEGTGRVRPGKAKTGSGNGEGRTAGELGYDGA